MGGINEKLLATPSTSLKTCYYPLPPHIFSSILGKSGAPSWQKWGEAIAPMGVQKKAQIIHHCKSQGKQQICQEDNTLLRPRQPRAHCTSAQRPTSVWDSKPSGRLWAVGRTCTNVHHRRTREGDRGAAAPLDEQKSATFGNFLDKTIGNSGNCSDFAVLIREELPQPP